jgi:hypothetical protein
MGVPSPGSFADCESSEAPADVCLPYLEPTAEVPPLSSNKQTSFRVGDDTSDITAGEIAENLLYLLHGYTTFERFDDTADRVNTPLKFTCQLSTS